MGRRGIKIQLDYIQQFEDRQGRWRYYFRKPGLPRVPLPGHPGSAEFMDAYNKAMNAEPLPEIVGPGRSLPGSFNRLIEDYFRSPKFLRTRASSQAVTKGILDRFAAKYGNKEVAGFKQKHLNKIIGEMASTPAAANNLLKKLRALLRWSIANEWRTDDPTVGVEKFKEGSHHTWTEAEIKTFEDYWPIGTRQRTAFALAVFTGQRREDLIRMTWSDIDPEEGTIRVVQGKTGAELDIYLHSDLKAVLESWPKHHLAILANEKGKGATSPASFGNFMAKAVEAAGLPERCVLHGLRKAAARRLAEAGCSAHQIMSITGHTDLREVQRYCIAAQQKGLSKSAIERVERTKQQ